MPLLPADFIHARGCKPICAKLLTLPAAEHCLPSEQVHSLLHFWSGNKKSRTSGILRENFHSHIPNVRPFGVYLPYDTMTRCSVLLDVILLSLPFLILETNRPYTDIEPSCARPNQPPQFDDNGGI